MHTKILFSAAYFGFMAVSIALLPMQVSADEIVLDNGVFLKGTVTGLAGELLFLTSDYAEPIKVKTEKIIRITTDKPLEIHLKSGEILKGNLKMGEDGILAVEKVPGRDKVAIELQNIAAINPPAVNQWKGSVSLAANSQTGNTERSALTFGVDTVRKNDQDRFSLRALYSIGEDKKIMTSRSAYGALKYDYFFTKKFYGYLAVELLNDTFKDLNLRTVVGPGVGYQVWDDARKALGLEAGIAYFSEDLKTGADKSWATARLAANYRYKLTETITFTDNLIMYPSLEQASDFKMRNEASLVTALGSGWSLKLANTLDYDNAAAKGIKKTDSNSMLGLQYAF